MQRAVFIAVLSFVFFLAMMIAYYIRAQIGYFLLATAFLLIYVVMMISWVMQRRSVVEVFENGLRYKKAELAWADIMSVSDEGIITPRSGVAVALPRAIDNLEGLVNLIRQRA